jgi:hypothetical protein
MGVLAVILKVPAIRGICNDTGWGMILTCEETCRDARSTIMKNILLLTIMCF